MDPPFFDRVRQHWALTTFKVFATKLFWDTDSRRRPGSDYLGDDVSVQERSAGANCVC